MTILHLVYWDAVTADERTVPVHDADEVAQLAEQLLGHYQQMRSDLPGLALQRGPAHWEGLSIAVAPGGWALFHLTEDLTPYCTKNTPAAAGEDVAVFWGEPTPVPRYEFIPVHLALVGVRQWFEDGTRSPLVPWSYQ